MAKKSSIVVKPGDDISWAGTITRTGLTSFEGYSLKAQFRAKGNCSETPQSLLATSTITWVDVTAGTFLLKVPRATTEKWPAGIIVLLDIQVVDPNDKRVRTESIEFKTEAGVTVLGGSGTPEPDPNACDCAEWKLVLDSNYSFRITGESSGVVLGQNTIIVNPPETSGQASAGIFIGPNAIVRLALQGPFSMYRNFTISSQHSVTVIEAYYAPESVSLVLGADGILSVYHPYVSPVEDNVLITLTVEVLEIVSPA